MTSSPIISWHTNGQNVETVSEFIYLGSKISVDGGYSHKIKTFASWKNSYDKRRQNI